MGAWVPSPLYPSILSTQHLTSPHPTLPSSFSQVAHDQALLRERIERLTGAEGVAQLEAALEAACAEVEENEDWETSSER